MARKISEHSGPVELSDIVARKLPTLRAAYSDRAAVLMAAFSQNAYLPFELPRRKRKAAGEPLDVSPDGYDTLERVLTGGGFKLAKVFNNGDVQAYLAIRPGELAVLAFRGTANFKDWCVDLNAMPTRLADFKNIEIHRGFWSAYAACLHDVQAAIDEHVPPTMPLYITGHSLGGALAQIASAILERDNLAACYTFGSPRVATRDFDSIVKCPHYRVVNSWDIVPGVPGSPYSHTGDPRLLMPGRYGFAPLRRDQSGMARLFVDIISIISGLFSHRLFVVDDHMIWNYRRRLQTIADARNTQPPST
jgi:hypothetical protein